MKKIVMLCASPRRSGNSNALAAAFAKALDGKAEIVRFDTQFMDIKRCLACDRCFSGDKPCLFDDDFNPAMEQIMSAEAIVIATGVYWYSFPSGLKAFFDKFYSLCTAGKNLAGKKVALLATCEDDTDDAFNSVCEAFDRSFELLGCENVGSVLVHGVHKIGDIYNTDGEKRAAVLAEKLVKAI